MSQIYLVVLGMQKEYLHLVVAPTTSEIAQKETLQLSLT